MPATVSVSAKPVHYPRTRSVEAALVAMRVAGTEGSAHQLILRTRKLSGDIAEAMAAVGAFDRLLWFQAPLSEALALMSPPAFEAACVDEQRADMHEDVLWEEYRANPTTENWRRYERAAKASVGRTLEKLRAGNAKHGGDA